MKVRVKLVLGLIVFCGVAGLGYLVWKMQQAGHFENLVFVREKVKPDGKKYEVLVEELGRWRGDLSKQYEAARTTAEKQAVENDARVLLELVMPEMMRCWLGTGYDFNGTAEKPGEGKVACGYYVSTVLRDAGFRVDRYKLAQQPSENILRTFLPRKSCILRVGVDYEEYADWVEGLEGGVYIIGLDTHVGFVIKREDDVFFSHSSGARLKGVVEERRNDAGAIRRSNWRMIGNLTREPQVLRAWLNGSKLTVKK